MGGLIRRHPLVAFFVLAFGGSWICWSPWWLSVSGLGILDLQLPASAILGINQLGLFAGPFTAAFLVTGIVDGRTGIRRLLRRFIQWRVHPIWYAVALVGLPLATATGYLLTPNAELEFAAAGGALLAVSYLKLLLGGPIQEEPGWRGFALPRLQARLHPLVAALVLGVIHCLWHAPLFLTREWDTPRDNAGELLAYLILVVSLSVVMSWLVNGAHGSLLLAILGHNGVNWAQIAVAVLAGVTVASTWPAALGMLILAVVAVVVTRGRLRYRPDGQSAHQLSQTH